MIARDDRRSEAITIHPVGGLGNQLFIYAAGRALATRLGCPLLVDPALYTSTLPGDTRRDFQLRWLVPEKDLLSTKAPSILTRLHPRLRSLLPFATNKHHVIESTFEFDPKILEAPIGTRLHGYFQSWRYFAGIEESLRNDLLKRSPQSPWGSTERTSVSQLGSWLAVHVRRGDYGMPRNLRYHGLLDASYYKRALASLDTNNQLPLVLFSDDVLEARRLIEPLHQIDHIVEPPPNVHPMEILSLMSGAQHIVIANSSFSWWAGWLALDAVIAAPKRWFVDSSIDTSDLLPTRFQTIECN